MEILETFLTEIWTPLLSDKYIYLAWLLAYLAGSFPTGYLITKFFFGFDITKKGSGNIGMTNVMRTSGKTPGIITFLIDYGKGFFILLLVFSLIEDSLKIHLQIAVFLVLLGHTKNIFLLFRGGKGVATNLGVWTYLSFETALGMAIIWLVIYRWKKLSSLAAIISHLMLPILVFFFDKDWIYLALLISIYILLNHHQNIKRLLSGKEYKI